MLGPILGMSGRPCDDFCVDKALIQMALVFDFIGQATGASLLLAGMASTKTVLVRNDTVMGAKVQWTAMPTSFGGTSAGVAGHRRRVLDLRDLLNPGDPRRVGDLLLPVGLGQHAHALGLRRARAVHALGADRDGRGPERHVLDEPQRADAVLGGAARALHRLAQERTAVFGVIEVLGRGQRDHEATAMSSARRVIS